MTAHRAGGSVSSVEASADKKLNETEALPRKFWLKRRRLIRPLFDRGREDIFTAVIGNIRILGRAVPAPKISADVPFQAGFAAGGRTRNAVERNRIRRLLRETFRRHQKDLRLHVERRADCLTLMILYRGDPAEAAQHIPRDLPDALDAFITGLT